MKESTIYGMYQSILKYAQQLEQSLHQLEQSARLGITGESVRNAALQKALIKKGLVTEADLTEAIGEVIREINQPKVEEPKAAEAAPATEAPKVELALPTTEEVQAVEKSTIEEPKQ
jgi:hypothetical protein